MNQNKSDRRIKVDYGAKQIYDYYKLNSLDPYGYSDYTFLLQLINTSISEAIIYNGFNFKLPFKVGDVSIVKQKLRPKITKSGKLNMGLNSINHKATQELWKRIYPDKTKEEILNLPEIKRVYHRNEHTNGYFFKWHFQPFYLYGTELRCYKFKASRKNNRELSSYLNSGQYTSKHYQLK